jgi:hypothetical protein
LDRDARRVRWAADYLEGLPVAGRLKAMALRALV